VLTPEEEIKNPLVLEFLGLKDEYSESDMEEAIIHHLEAFLLELGTDFAFVGRQKRLRIDDSWYRVDLVFFHRRPKCLVLIDLKLQNIRRFCLMKKCLLMKFPKLAELWKTEKNNQIKFVRCPFSYFPLPYLTVSKF